MFCHHIKKKNSCHQKTFRCIVTKYKICEGIVRNKWVNVNFERPDKRVATLTSSKAFEKSVLPLPRSIHRLCAKKLLNKSSLSRELLTPLEPRPPPPELLSLQPFGGRTFPGATSNYHSLTQYECSSKEMSRRTCGSETRVSLKRGGPYKSPGCICGPFNARDAWTKACAAPAALPCRQADHHKRTRCCQTSRLTNKNPDNIHILRWFWSFG